MARKIRAGKTKQKLFEITEQLSGQSKGTSSLEVVTEFRKIHNDVIDTEFSDIIEYGLMSIAGGVAVSKRSVDGQKDLYSDSGYPRFIGLPTKSGNTISSKRYDARNITPEQFFSCMSQKSDKKEEIRKQSENHNYEDIMKEMKQKGLVKMTVPEYLNSK